MFLEQQIIIMISEGSWDTEDWSNDAENTALITNKLHLKIYSHGKLFLNDNNILIKYKNIQIIFQSSCFVQ